MKRRFFSIGLSFFQEPIGSYFAWFILQWWKWNILISSILINHNKNRCFIKKKKKKRPNFSKSYFTLRFEIDRILRRVVNALCFFFFFFYLFAFFVVRSLMWKKRRIDRWWEKKRLTRFRSLFPTMMKRCNMMSVRKENDLLTKSGDVFIYWDISMNIIGIEIKRDRFQVQTNDDD